MRLNEIKPAEGSRKEPKRLGRGHSAGQGKTSGRGVKGQHARSGGYHKVGFNSRKSRYAGELRLGELAKLDGEVDLLALKAAGLVGQEVKRVKIIASGKIDKAVTVKGLAVTAGARAAIEAAGGKIEE
jgi:large subunit ribosomal protein L15